ncbi:hypothetical protein HKI87_02g17300 [Chloropicon roscoffensis]|uniref:ATP synthase subunit e, mitochondrial n=1 Tax=Chloropicon roscoffensis TaxID=1461544 RepID=A0AAX4P2K1_9CHLO|mmetsp:Transcript_9946/g.30286  ORF Transcript_9946/g.30286 Transcript_9946/m.30286 type:complete len:136 (+) Transcript_9946:77-484(+)
MNVPMNFMRTNLLRYWENYFLKKPFRPVVHVMWTIGIAGAWYEGIHHRSLEKAHAAAAEVKRVELKEKHTFAMKALGDHDQQLVEAEEFIRISKAAIEGAKHHIVDLQKKKKELEKAAEDSKNAYENYKPAPFGH